MTATEKLTFAYLLYTAGPDTNKTLLRCFKTCKAAVAHIAAIVSGEMVLNGDVSGSNRIAQRLNKANGQYWFVEKHLLCDR